MPEPETKACDRPCWGPRLVLTDVWRTCNKIRAAVFRGGLNLWTYFRPIDPQNNSLISEAQFVSVLEGPLKDAIGLTSTEIAHLADYFRVHDGRIFYTQFCEIIHDSVPNFCSNRPLITGLEWNDPFHVNTLSPAEECRLQLLLTKIATLVNMRQLVLLPYFQDYELIAKNTGAVTFAHFARVLNYLGILLCADDFNLLVKKFVKDSYTVNYVAFVTAIDAITRQLDAQMMLDVGGSVLSAYPGRCITAELPKLPRPEIGRVRTEKVFGTPNVFHPVLLPPPRPMDVVEILRRFQRHVLGTRCRVGEFFKDFDPMRCGRITEAQFKRALDMIGCSGLQRFFLSEMELERLCVTYRDPNDPSRICYRTFEDDMDQVFTVKELEKCPEVKLTLPPPEVTELPRKGARDWHGVPVMQRDICEAAVEKVKQRICKRRLDFKPFFADYDKFHTGHVTRSQFRQVLAGQGVLLSIPEADALDARYGDDLGFNYIWFMREAEPKRIEPPKYPVYLSELKAVNGPRPQRGPAQIERDIVEVLAKIKMKVVREGIRPIEFMRPFDLHNENHITADEFARGLTTARFDLTPTEMYTVIDAFGTPGRPGHVDYRRFCSTVEEAVAQTALERAPLIEPLQHLPHRSCCRNFLNFEERAILSRALKKISEHPFRNLEEVFQDHDHCKVGLVTPDQLLQVLTLRGLTIYLSNNEIAAVAKAFGVRRGLHDDFDYMAFIQALHLLHVNKYRRIF